MCDNMVGDSASSGEEGERQVLYDFANISADPPTKRPICERCRRPMSVCWCCHLPSPPLNISSRIYILQHPYEQNRRLKTAPMLLHGLQAGACHIYIGKRFPLERIPRLAEVLTNRRTLLLYPSPDALDLADLCRAEDEARTTTERMSVAEQGTPGAVADEPYHLVLLDGTWMQAKGIYNQNKFLQKLRQVKISSGGVSEYVIRTQPTDGCLSTLETAAVALSTLERRPDITPLLLRPLRALCAFQMQHGAVTHHSKQLLIDNGLYKKPISRRSSRNKLTKASSMRTQTTSLDDSIASNVD